MRSGTLTSTCTRATLRSQNQSCVLVSLLEWVLTLQKGFNFDHTSPFATRGLGCHCVISQEPVFSVENPVWATASRTVEI